MKLLTCSQPALLRPFRCACGASTWTCTLCRTTRGRSARSSSNWFVGVASVESCCSRTCRGGVSPQQETSTILNTLANRQQSAVQLYSESQESRTLHNSFALQPECIVEAVLRSQCHRACFLWGCDTALQKVRSSDRLLAAHDAEARAMAREDPRVAEQEALDDKLMSSLFGTRQL